MKQFRIGKKHRPNSTDRNIRVQMKPLNNRAGFALMPGINLNVSPARNGFPDTGDIAVV
jgi:hypothetical protein